MADAHTAESLTKRSYTYSDTKNRKMRTTLSDATKEAERESEKAHVPERESKYFFNLYQDTCQLEEQRCEIHNDIAEEA